MKFEKGVRVVRRNGTELVPTGTLGTVTFRHHFSEEFMVDWDNGFHHDHYRTTHIAEGHIEPAPAPPPVLARAANPANQHLVDAFYGNQMSEAQLAAQQRGSQQSTQQGLGGEAPAPVRWRVEEHGAGLLGRAFVCCGKPRDIFSTSTYVPGDVGKAVGYARIATCGACGTIHLGALVSQPEKGAAYPSAERTTPGDLAGERDRLKLALDVAETDLAFWKREAIRLKGGRR